MADEKLLTVREVSLLLGINEKEVMNLAEEGKIPAYKVGGVFLRFKREQVMDFKKTFIRPTHKIHNVTKYSLKDKASDFFYFNDFYILALLLIVLIIYIIFNIS